MHSRALFTFLIFLFMNHWNIFRVLILKIKTQYIMAVFPIAFLQGDAERQSNLLIMEVEALRRENAVGGGGRLQTYYETFAAMLYLSKYGERNKSANEKNTDMASL